VALVRNIMLIKIKRELERFRKRLFCSGKKYKQLEELRFRLENMPYEIYDKITNGDLRIQIPIVRSPDETLDKILQDRCSLSRFGDGEFLVMHGSRIHFQNPSPQLAQRLKEVIASNIPNLLISLPDFFGSLDNYVPSVVNFWRKWMSLNREKVYPYLNMNRLYYSTLFNSVYMHFIRTEEHYEKCGKYFERLKKIWMDRDVVICEGEGTRFGMFNDLLSGAKSISRILCPARSAFDKYDRILSAFNGISADKLVLAALGPTATVLAYDLCKRGYQAVDVGHLDVEYEWFLRKSTESVPLEFKYVDGTSKGRKIRRLDDPEYKKQIIKILV
jgi:glycosyltransferase family protein